MQAQKRKYTPIRKSVQATRARPEAAGKGDKKVSLPCFFYKKLHFLPLHPADRKDIIEEKRHKTDRQTEKEIGPS